MLRWLLLALCACGAPRVAVVVPVTLASALTDPASVQSFELWVLNQVGRDDQPISCDQLLSRAIPPASDNSYVIKRVAANFDGSDVAVKDLPIGEQNRIFYVDLYDQADQLGLRVGAGCAQAVTISGGKTVQVELSIDKPPSGLPK